MKKKETPIAPPLSTQAKTLQEKTDEEIYAEKEALEAELIKRREERKKQKEQERSSILEEQYKMLEWEIINAFAPFHGKKNCSDTEPNQDWDGLQPACIRCSLIEVKSGGPWDLAAPFVFQMSVRRHE